MSKLTGTRVVQPIVPSDNLDTYPTHLDVYGHGGYRSVDNLSERDSIHVDRQKKGMAVYVVEESKMYILRAVSTSLTEAHWQTLDSGGTGGTSIIISDTVPEDPTDGLLWLNTIDEQIFIFVTDRWERFVLKETMASDDGDLLLNGGYF